MHIRLQLRILTLIAIYICFRPSLKPFLFAHLSANILHLVSKHLLQKERNENENENEQEMKREEKK